ncbi:protein arginine N-methyltransferase 1-like [Paramacrobiotus metropolitanus]|uniref:protein arginine N-methyltransferase 1-like n=1 Tax=Paramacrobiotus metropolitanus TaxID=2943436 RepID=UPI0024461FD3|nr:protein arginine N-methyltransferase 1-like [Paramacrobiotus metropolitanus]
MGYFLLFEGMLGIHIFNSVLLARDKYLAPNGTMIPSRASLFLTAISDMESWETRVGLWDNAYGLRFRCLKDHSLKFPGVDEVRDEHVVTSRSTLREWDLMTCTTRDLEFETRVMVRVLKTSSLTALVGFFDVGYNNPTAGLQTMLCTGPSFPVTHWAQSVFYLEKPFPVTEGQELNIATRIMKCRDDHRGLEVTFRIFNGEGVGNNLEETCLWQQTYQL